MEAKTTEERVPIIEITTRISTKVKPFFTKSFYLK
jgi:hypothetical protein